MNIRMPVKVVPGSSRDGIAGWLGEALKVRVRAPAERGKANAAVCRIVAEALGVPAKSVRIASGGGSPRKIIEIEDLPHAEVLRRLVGVAGEPSPNKSS